MCIIISNKAGQTLPKEYIENSWKGNRDGAGMCYVENGKVQIEKFVNEGYGGYQMHGSNNYDYDLEALLYRYQEIREKLPESNILLHFRISTSGFGDDNLHPFPVKENRRGVKLAMMHNGIINGLGDNGRSDTREFVEEYLAHLPMTFLNNKGSVRLISDFIGPYNKLAFLDEGNNVHILNEDAGHYDELGNWFSNDSYMGRNRYAGSRLIEDDENTRDEFSNWGSIYSDLEKGDDYPSDDDDGILAGDTFDDRLNYCSSVDEECPECGKDSVVIYKDQRVGYCENCYTQYSCEGDKLETLII